MNCKNLLAALLLFPAALLTLGGSLGRAANIELLGSFIPEGIDGMNMVGLAGNNIYTDDSFLYDGNTFTKIAYPGAARTFAAAIFGSNIVGDYMISTNGKENGFLYNGSSYVTINDPNGVKGTVPTGLDGSNVVGYYEDANLIPHGFIYNITTSTWTTLDNPAGIDGTLPSGIDGSIIVGTYWDPPHIGHGFWFDGTTWHTLAAPVITADGISGNQIVGFDGSGYIYNVATNTYSHPLTLSQFPAGNTQFGFNGISGNTIIGNYSANDLNPSGFVFTVPEPSAIALAISGLACLAWQCRRWVKRN